MLKKRWFIIVGAGVAVAAIAFVVHAHHGEGTPGAGHDHGHAAKAGEPPKLTLNNGQKWQTDARLKQEMGAIRDEMGAALDGVHAGTTSAEQYEALAGRIEERVASIFTNCKLPPEVDAQAHIVLTQLLAGIAAMKGDGDRLAGAVKIVGALAAYGQYFDHPGWTPLEH